MSAIDDIQAIDDKLSDWIIHTSPSAGDATGLASMRQAISLHTQLDQQLTALQLGDLQAESAALAAVLASQGPVLTGLRTRITAVQSGITAAESVISFAAQAIAAAVKIMGVVAAL
jgi:hypothetical protein